MLCEILSSVPGAVVNAPQKHALKKHSLAPSISLFLGRNRPKHEEDALRVPCSRLELEHEACTKIREHFEGVHRK
jgi:hypothetical protein